MLFAVTNADCRTPLAQYITMKRHSHPSIFDLHGKSQRMDTTPKHGHFTMLGTHYFTGFQEFQQLILVIDQAWHAYLL